MTSFRVDSSRPTLPQRARKEWGTHVEHASLLLNSKVYESTIIQNQRRRTGVSALHG